MEITLELALGILGSVTGVSSLILEVKRYLKDKPRIEAEIVDTPRHSYYDQEDKCVLILVIRVRVRNKGNRAITIGEARLIATHGNQSVKLSCDNVDERIEPNDLVSIELSFNHLFSFDQLLKQDAIPFELVLYHAHGEIKGLKGVSRVITKEESKQSRAAIT